MLEFVGRITYLLNLFLRFEADHNFNSKRIEYSHVWWFTNPLFFFEREEKVLENLFYKIKKVSFGLVEFQWILNH